MNVITPGWIVALEAGAHAEATELPANTSTQARHGAPGGHRLRAQARNRAGRRSNVLTISFSVIR